MLDEMTIIIKVQLMRNNFKCKVLTACKNFLHCRLSCQNMVKIRKKKYSLKMIILKGKKIANKIHFNLFLSMEILKVKEI